MSKFSVSGYFWVMFVSSAIQTNYILRAALMVYFYPTVSLFFDSGSLSMVNINIKHVKHVTLILLF